MNIRVRAALVAAISSLALTGLAAPAANANVLSLLPGSCGNQTETQPFSQWGDSSQYVAVPGGSFEAGSPAWALTGGASVVSGNESYYVGGAGDSHSLSLPAGSTATSPAICTSIYHPTLRLFVRNTGDPSSRLKVEALYPGLLGGVQVAQIGSISGSSSWSPTPTTALTVQNLLATVSVNQTAIAFRFVPADSAGKWSIDDAFVDPFCK